VKLKDIMDSAPSSACIGPSQKQWLLGVMEDLSRPVAAIHLGRGIEKLSIYGSSPEKIREGLMKEGSTGRVSSDQPNESNPPHPSEELLEELTSGKHDSRFFDRASAIDAATQEAKEKGVLKWTAQQPMEVSTMEKNKGSAKEPHGHISKEVSALYKELFIDKSPSVFDEREKKFHMLVERAGGNTLKGIREQINWLLFERGVPAKWIRDCVLGVDPGQDLFEELFLMETDREEYLKRIDRLKKLVEKDYEDVEEYVDIPKLINGLFETGMPADKVREEILGEKSER